MILKVEVFIQNRPGLLGQLDSTVHQPEVIFTAQNESQNKSKKSEIASQSEAII